MTEPRRHAAQPVATQPEDARRAGRNAAPTAARPHRRALPARLLRVPGRHCTTAPLQLHHCTTAPLHHRTTAPPHHRATARSAPRTPQAHAQAQVARRRKRRKPASSDAGFQNPGSVLLSHRVAPAVPSAQKSLTSVFGMGTGVTSSVLPPGKKLRSVKRQVSRRQMHQRACA